MAANINNEIYDELAQTWRDENEFLQLLKVMVNPLATLWDVRQQKQGKISFGELGRRLVLKLDEDLALNYLGYACRVM